MIAALIYVLAGLTVAPFNQSSDLIIAAIALIYFSTLLLFAIKGHTHLSSWLLVIGLLVVFSSATLIDAGVYDVAYPGFIIPVLIGSFMLGTRVAILTLCISSGVGLLSVALAIYPVNYQQVGLSGPVTVWITQTTYLFIGVVLLDLAMRSLSSAIQQAQESEQQQARQFHLIRNIIDAIPDLIFVKDRTGHMILVNNAMAEFDGFGQPDEMIGKKTVDLYPAEAAQQFLATDEMVFETGLPFTDIQNHMINQSTGEARSAIVTKVPLHNQTGEIIGLVGIAHDVTERLQLEDHIRYQANLLENVTEAIISADPNMVVRSWNKAAEKIYGIPAAEAIGRPSTELFTTEYLRASKAETLRQFFEQGHAEEDVIQTTRDGRQLHVECSATVLCDDTNNITGIVSVNRDVTERKQAERALQESQERLRLFMNASTDFISIFDSDLRFVDVNETTLYILNRTREEVIGTPLVTEDSPPELLERARLYRDVLKTGKPVHVDGAPMPFVNTLGRIYTLRAFKVGSGLGVVGTDITERVQAQRTLQEREERLKLFVDASTDSITICDSELNIVEVNETATHFTGRPRDQIIGTRLTDISSHPEFLKRIDQYRQVIATGQPLHIEATSLRGVSADSQLYSLRAYKVGDGIGIVATDITERKQAERLRMELEAERALLEMKNRYMSVISHEFRTPLSTISSTTSLLEIYWDRIPDEDRVGYLQRTHAQISRLDQLLNDFSLAIRAESGFIEYEPGPLDIISFCKDIVDDFQNSQNSQHHFEISHDDRTTLIEADSRLLGYVLRNLISNAIKYSPYGGQITLSLASQNREVAIQVSDEGIGIPQEEQANLFGSYFRGSNVGHIYGTGLGLKIVKDFVEMHGGRIEVESELNQGTTFTLYLPASVEIA